MKPTPLYNRAAAAAERAYNLRIRYLRVQAEGDAKTAERLEALAEKAMDRSDELYEQWLREEGPEWLGIGPPPLNSRYGPVGARE